MIVPSSNSTIKYQTSLIGIPQFLAIQNNWHCLRIRMFIFIQIQHLLLIDSIIYKYYLVLCNKYTVLKAQMLIAPFLPIRFVKENGVGSHLNDKIYDVDLSIENNSYEIDELHCDLSDNDGKIYGSWFPSHNKLTIGMFSHSFTI